MFYYIRTKKEQDYEISEPYSTFAEAKHKLENMHKKNREKSKIVEIPEIREGLHLYRMNGAYLGTIIGESKNLYYVNRLDDRKDTTDDGYRKETVLRWFIEEKLYPVESYAEGINFVHIQDLELGDTDEKIS